MPEANLCQGPQPPADPAVAERRGCPRYRCHPAPVVRFVVRPFFRTHRGAVRDISATGVGLIVWLPLEPGAVLLLQLPGPREGETHTRLARVTRTLPQIGLNYRVGCRFASPLSDAEVDALVRPPAPSP